MAKICISSTRCYDTTINELASVWCQDLELYNKMVRYAYKVVLDNYRYHNFDIKTLHKHLKQKYHTNDYFPLSAVSKAKTILKSQLALQSEKKNTIRYKISDTTKKLKQEQRKLEKDILVLKQLIDYTRKTSKEIVSKEIRVEGNQCMYQGQYMSLYLYEVQILKPRIKQAKHKISMLGQRLNILMNQLDTMRLKGICFGGKKRMKARTTIYQGKHEEWLEEYQRVRNHQMEITGRAQGKYGNNLFKYDGKTMTYIAVSKEKYYLPLDFPYRKEELLRVLAMPHATPGKAVCYTLVRKKNYFIIKATIELEPKACQEDTSVGVVGVDINVDHMALCQTDNKGNIIDTCMYRYCLEGKSSNQRKHILQNVIATITEYCKQVDKPLIIEQLQFKQRYSRYTKRKKRNKTLSEFAYNQIKGYIHSSGYTKAIGVIEVDPAYTSRIGKMKYSKSKGMSVHLAASYCIARKGQGYKEGIPKELKAYVVDNKQSLQQQWKQIRV